MKRSLCAISMGLALFACHWLASRSVAADAAPNVVILFADDLGYGDLGCFGHPTIATPHVDRMAAEGMRLTSFYSAPSCVPARIQLMTGRYPPRTAIVRTSVGGNGGIPDREVTLAESLKAAGHRTAMLGKWHLGYARDEYLPVGQGFDTWFGLPYSNDMRKPWVQTDVPLWLYENAQKIENPVDHETLTERYTERAVRFIQDSAADGPFFLYVAYNMPHLPIVTTDRFRGRSRAGLYGDVIETIDWSAGQILDALKANGVDEQTLVIFTSDNGPWPNMPPRMLAGGVELWHAGSTGPLNGAKGTLYEGGVRVPCIVRWPNNVRTGASAEMASTLDLYATIVKAAGGRLPDHKVDGLDLMPWLAGQTEKSPRESFYFCAGMTAPLAVRVGSWKLIRRDGVELYDLDVDPGERFNRAEANPEVVERLSALLKAMATELGGEGATRSGKAR